MRGIRFKKTLLVYVMLVCISFMIPDLSSAKLDPDTLSGIWFFDEGKGGEAKDSSENGNDGEIVEAQWVDGKFEGALKFEGGGHVAVGDFSDYEDEVSIVALIIVESIISYTVL